MGRLELYEIRNRIESALRRRPMSAWEIHKYKGITLASVQNQLEYLSSLGIVRRYEGLADSEDLWEYVPKRERNGQRRQKDKESDNGEDKGEMDNPGEEDARPPEGKHDKARMPPGPAGEAGLPPGREGMPVCGRGLLARSEQETPEAEQEVLDEEIREEQEEGQACQ